MPVMDRKQLTVLLVSVANRHYSYSTVQYAIAPHCNRVNSVVNLSSLLHITLVSDCIKGFIELPTAGPSF